MKIIKSYLKQVIKEEYQKIINEGEVIDFSKYIKFKMVIMGAWHTILYDKTADKVKKITDRNGNDVTEHLLRSDWSKTHYDVNKFIQDKVDSERQQGNEKFI